MYARQLLGFARPYSLARQRFLVQVPCVFDSAAWLSKTRGVPHITRLGAHMPLVLVVWWWHGNYKTTISIVDRIRFEANACFRTSLVIQQPTRNTQDVQMHRDTQSIENKDTVNLAGSWARTCSACVWRKLSKIPKNPVTKSGIHVNLPICHQIYSYRRVQTVLFESGYGWACLLDLTARSLIVDQKSVFSYSWWRKIITAVSWWICLLVKSKLQSVIVSVCAVPQAHY